MEARELGSGEADDQKSKRRIKRVRVDPPQAAVSAVVARRSLNLSISPETYKRAKMFAAYVDRDLSDLFTEWLGTASRGFVVSQRGGGGVGGGDSTADPDYSSANPPRPAV